MSYKSGKELEDMKDTELASLEARNHPNSGQGALIRNEWRRRERTEQHKLNKKIMFRSSLYGWLGAILGAIVGVLLTVALTRGAQPNQSPLQKQTLQQNLLESTKSTDHFSSQSPMNKIKDFR